MTELTISGLFVLGGLAASAALAAAIWWLWFAPLYHPLDCVCRRCAREARLKEKRDRRLRGLR